MQPFHKVSSIWPHIRVLFILSWDLKVVLSLLMDSSFQPWLPLLLGFWPEHCLLARYVFGLMSLSFMLSRFCLTYFFLRIRIVLDFFPKSVFQLSSKSESISTFLKPKNPGFGKLHPWMSRTLKTWNCAFTGLRVCKSHILFALKNCGSFTRVPDKMDCGYLISLENKKNDPYNNPELCML